MEAPTATEITATRNPIAHSKWSDYNGKNDYAELEFVVTPTLNDLPAKILAAITTAGLSKAGLDTQEVNWTVRCLSTDGKTALGSTSKVYSGNKSSKIGCGEIGMWFNDASNVKDSARPRASAEFTHLSAIYVINAGLCPCKRCAFGLMALARELRSIIIVSPQTDYDYLDANSSRVDVSSDPVYLHVYDSSLTKVQVFSSRAKPAHLEEVVVAQRALAPFICTKKHQVQVLFPSVEAMNVALKPLTGKEAKSATATAGRVYNCPVCRHQKVQLRHNLDFKPGGRALAEHAVGTLTEFDGNKGRTAL